MPSPQRACTSTYLHDLLLPPREPVQTVDAESEPRLPAKAGARAGAHPTALVGAHDDLRRVAPRAPPLRLSIHRVCASVPPRPIDPATSSEKNVKLVRMFRAGDGAGDPGRLVVHLESGLGHIFAASYSLPMESWLALCERVIDSKGGATGRVA